jgi:hypothetical protein
MLLACLAAGSAAQTAQAAPPPSCPVPGHWQAETPTKPQQNVRFALGQATSLDGRFRYCEYHQILEDNRYRVDYEQEGKRFAEKTLHFHGLAWQPDSDQTDSRTQEKRQVIRENSASQGVQEANVTLAVNYQASSKAKRLATALPLTPTTVIDAGFNRFIQHHWRDLTEGKTLTLDFISPVHQRAIPLRAMAIPNTDCAITTNDMALCVKVEAAATWVRWFVDPLWLAYNAKQQLSVFQGAVNITDAKGKSLEARIDYRYFE